MELYIPIERPHRNLKNGRFLKGNVPHNKGKKWSEWMDGRKINKVRRIAMANLRPNMAIGGWNAKPIIAYTDDQLYVAWFASSADAERKTGIWARNIRSVCEGKRKKAGGFRWKYD